MSILGKLQTALSLLQADGSLKALITWPRFSITSFKMVSRLAGQGISPGSVLDVGANVGQFTVAVAKFFPSAKVHSFEPVPVCIGKLRKNVSSLENVTVYPVALGDNEGEALIHLNSYSHSSSVLSLARAHRDAFPEAKEVGTVAVEMTTLDLITEKLELRSPVLLKLDVQGYEAETLRGGVETLKRVDYVVLETSFKPMYENEPVFMDLVRIMEDQGFRFEQPVGWLEAPQTGEVLQMDALFVRDGKGYGFA